MLVLLSAPVLFRFVFPSGGGSSAGAIGIARAYDGFYLRNNMWLADARTFVSLVRYLFQPDPRTSITTNIVVNG